MPEQGSPREELAVIRDPSYGIVDDHDLDTPKLRFTVEMLSGEALQILDQEHSCRVIAESRVEDVKRLAGRTCIVSRDGNMVRFVRLR